MLNYDCLTEMFSILPEFEGEIESRYVVEGVVIFSSKMTYRQVKKGIFKPWIGRCWLVMLEPSMLVAYPK